MLMDKNLIWAVCFSLMSYVFLFAPANAAECTYTPNPSGNVDLPKRFIVKLYTNDISTTGDKLAHFDIQHLDGFFPKNGRVSVRINGSRLPLTETNNLSSTVLSLNYSANQNKLLTYFSVSSQTSNFVLDFRNTVDGSTDQKNWNVSVTCTTTDTTNPNIQIISPTRLSTYRTSQPSIIISGTASDNKEVTDINWSSSSTGDGGLAVITRTTNSTDVTWKTRQAVRLNKGSNNFSFIARDQAGNTKERNITIIYEQPDLKISSSSVTNPSQVFLTGGTISGHATIKNQGQATANATTVRYYLSTGPLILTNDIFLGSKSVISLASGADITRNESLRIPGNLSDGTYYFGACVHAVTSESSISNNCTEGAGVAITIKRQPILRTLSISLPANGTITDNYGKINCPATCSATYEQNTSITLTASPKTGYKFDSFSGCTADTNKQCTLILSRNKNVSAQFSPNATTNRLRVDVKTHNGTISSNPTGIVACGKNTGTCTDDFAVSSVELTANPDPGYEVKFASCTSVSGNSCNVDMTSDKTIIASFEPKPTTTGSLELEFDTFPQRNHYTQSEDFSIKLRVKAKKSEIGIKHVDVNWTGSENNNTNVVTCKSDNGSAVIKVGDLLDCSTADISNNKDIPLGWHTLTGTAYNISNEASNTLKFHYKILSSSAPVDHFIGTQDPAHMKQFWVIDPNTDKKGFYVDTARGTQVLQLNFLHQTGIMGLDFSLQYNSGFARENGLELGKGWNHNYGMFAHLDTSNESTGLVLKWSNNREIAYTKVGNEYINTNAPEEGRLSGYYDRIIKDTDGTYLLTKKDKSKYRFSSTGVLNFIKNKHQQTLSLTHNTTGQLTKIREINSANQDTGIYLTYTYDSFGQIKTVTDAADRTVTHYYQDSCLTAISDPEGIEHKFTLKPGTCLITGYERHKGNKTVVLFKNNVYGSLDEVRSQQDGKGNITTFAYDESSHPGFIETTIVTPENIETRDTYNTNYQLIEHMVATARNSNLVYSTQYGYTRSGMLRRKREHGLKTRQDLDSTGGRITEYEYDGNGNTTKIIYPDGNFITREYDIDNNLTKEISETGAVTTYIYNSSDSTLASMTKPYAEIGRATTSYLYNSDAQPIEIHSPRTSLQPTKLTYENGRVKTTTDPEGNTVSNDYNAVGNVTKTTIRNANGSLTKIVDIVTDKLGRTIVETTHYAGNALSVDTTYSLCGGIATVTDAKTQTSTYLYDANCNLEKIQEPLSKTTTFFYDKDNRKTGTEDAENHRNYVQYNVLGQITETQNSASQSIVSNEYDAYSNLRAVNEQADGYGSTGFLANESEYDARNRKILSADAHHKTTYSRDSYGRLISINEFDECNTNAPKTCSSSSRSKKFNYYSDNKIKKVTAPVTNTNTVTASQTFDAEGNRTQLKDPKQNTTGFDFDGNNQEKKQTPAAGLASNKHYNALQLLDWIKNGRNQEEAYTYYENGWLKTITLKSENKAWTYNYDNNGNVLTISGPDGVIERRYDALNRVTFYKDPIGLPISYTYYNNNQLKTISYDGHTVNYTYDNNNRLHTVSWDNSLIVSYAYTRQGRLKKETRANGTEREYFYIKDRLVSISDKKGATSIVSFTYDYNDIGDITKESITPEPPTEALLIPKDTMTYGSDNRIVTYNTQTVSFDDDGNMTRGPLGDSFATFVYDQRNRLTKAGSTEYTYTVENHRIKVKQDNLTTEYLVNPHASLSQVLMKKEANGTKTYYIYGLGLIAQVENSNKHFYHYDLRGSTVALSNNSGGVSNRFSYTLFGELLGSDVSIETPFSFHARDGVIKDNKYLIYMRNRFYHNGIRRFMSRDTVKGFIRTPTTLNRYAFVNNNPVSNVDPRGLFFDDIKDWTVRAEGNLYEGAARVGAVTFAVGAAGGVVLSNILEGTLQTGETLANAVGEGSELVVNGSRIIGSHVTGAHYSGDYDYYTPNNAASDLVKKHVTTRFEQSIDPWLTVAANGTNDLSGFDIVSLGRKTKNQAAYALIGDSSDLAFSLFSMTSFVKAQTSLSRTSTGFFRSSRQMGGYLSRSTNGIKRIKWAAYIGIKNIPDIADYYNSLGDAENVIGRLRRGEY